MPCELSAHKKGGGGRPRKREVMRRRPTCFHIILVTLAGCRVRNSRCVLQQELQNQQLSLFSPSSFFILPSSLLSSPSFPSFFLPLAHSRPQTNDYRVTQQGGWEGQEAVEEPRAFSYLPATITVGTIINSKPVSAFFPEPIPVGPVAFFPLALGRKTVSLLSRTHVDAAT